MSGQFAFAGILKEESEDWLDEGRNVHLELLPHGQDDLLNQQDDGVLNRAGGAPEVLQMISNLRWAYFQDEVQYSSPSSDHIGQKMVPQKRWEVDLYCIYNSGFSKEVGGNPQSKYALISKCPQHIQGLCSLGDYLVTVKKIMVNWCTR